MGTTFTLEPARPPLLLHLCFQNKEVHHYLKIAQKLTEDVTVTGISLIENLMPQRPL